MTREDEMNAAAEKRKNLKFDPVSLDEIAEAEFKAGWLAADESHAKYRVTSALLGLDGVAAVNLDEPSHGDLERVVKAYHKTREELAAIKTQPMSYYCTECGEDKSLCYNLPAVKLIEENDKLKKEYHDYKVHYDEILERYELACASDNAHREENESLTSRSAKLLEVLESISKNSCCNQCQEAKKVAEAAIAEYKKSTE